MTHHPYSGIRCTALAAPLIALLLLLAPATTHAQIGQCACKKIQIANQKATACCVSLVFAGASEYTQQFCPNTTQTVACEDGMTISVVDCKGNEHPLHFLPSPCVTNIPIADGCCVDVCISITAQGCYLVDIRPSAVDCVCQ